jgi:hypothetical protein
MMHLSLRLWVALTLALTPLRGNAGSQSDAGRDDTALLEPQQARCYVPSKNGLLWLLKELGPDGPALTESQDKAMREMLKSGKLDEALLKEINPLVPGIRQFLTTALRMPCWQSKWQVTLSRNSEPVFGGPGVIRAIKVIACSVLANFLAGQWDQAIKDCRLLDLLGARLRDNSSDYLECLMGSVANHLLIQVVAGLICVPEIPTFRLTELAEVLDDTIISLEGWRECSRHEFRLRRVQCTGIHNLEDWKRTDFGDEWIHDYAPEDVKAFNDHFSYYYDEKKTIALLEGRYAQMIKFADQVFTTAGHPSFIFKDGIKKPIEDWNFPNSIGTGLVVYFSNSEKVLKSVLRIRSCRTLVRTALAVELYRRDQGKLPGQLQDLLPRYLKSLPKDSLDGKIVSYDPDQGLLYVTGMDLQREHPALPETLGLKSVDSGDVFRLVK